MTFLVAMSLKYYQIFLYYVQKSEILLKNATKVTRG